MNKKSARRVFFTTIVWALFVLPFVVYVYYACSFSVNVPFWDDYGAVLAFMNNFVQAGALDAKLRLLFSQHNEHRLVFNRVVLLAQYFLIGKIDFKSLMIFGDLGWIMTVLVFVFRYKRKFRLPLLHLLPVPYVLLAFVQWENMFFATPSIQFYWFVLFSVVFFFCLMDNKSIQASSFSYRSLYFWRWNNLVSSRQLVSTCAEKVEVIMGVCDFLDCIRTVLFLGLPQCAQSPKRCLLIHKY